jgi:hypothetical protein
MNNPDHARHNNRLAILLLVALSLILSSPQYVKAECCPNMADYLAYPPFLTSKVAPNILLILDNSGSMNQFAYHEYRGKRCGKTYTCWTGYDPGKEYYGLFNPNKCYRYDNTHHYFYEDGDTVDDPATTDIFERSTGSDPTVRKFSGNWLNWWTMRRIDVAKKVLTGGRIAPDTTDTVLEGMSTDDRDVRRIFNDHTTAEQPGILTGGHEKNVYYTPFHQGFYSWWFNVDRADHMGGNPNEFVPMFNVITAVFDQITDLTGGTCVDLPGYVDLTVPANPADNGYNTGEKEHGSYNYHGYIVAVKVESDELPVQGIIQKMADRVRFGYMQFNLGTGPGEGAARNAIPWWGNWDIDDDGTTDLTWRYADGGRVRNYVGDTSTTTDPHGDEVLQIVQNINQQNIQMNTPLEEVLWEAIRYFRQVTPEFQPEDSPDTPPANSVDFERSNTWDPYYFNDLGEFIPCAKSFIIFLSDGKGNENSGQPTADWPAGASTKDLTGDGDGYLDDMAFNMHTQDLRDDIAMGETSDLVDQTITLYSVFCFDDSDSARCEMMKAARAGGFIDLNGDGDTGGTVSENDPTAFVGDLEWDRDENNVPDTFFEAQNGAEMEEKIMLAITDILSRTASGTAASVISNARGGEGAIYQAVFFTESDAEPLTGDTVKWYGNIHSLFVDQYGNMREDTDGDHALDLDVDRIVEFDGETAIAQLYKYDSVTKTKTFDEQVEVTDLKFIWDALSWLSSTSMDVTTQRDYDSNTAHRYIFTDHINTSLPVSISNVDSTTVMDFLPGFVDDSINDNYYFLNPYLTYDDDANSSTAEVPLSENDMITEAQNIIRFIRGEEGLTETRTGIYYRNRTLDMSGDGSDDTVFRLGDIIHSTPTVVSQPAEDYDLIYKDDSYRAFRKKYLNRRIMIYAGANDGMFHAFNGGFYDACDHKFIIRPEIWDSNSLAWVPDTSKTDFALGAEMWAYVPNAVLPQLKWLAEPLSQNTHVYYVDLKPRVFDAKIFYQADGTTPLDADHPGGWGTVLIGGMRLGGKPIGVDTNNDGTCDLNFRSAYFALDVTNPEVAPSLLWSFSDSNLGFTTSYPTPIRVGNKWFVVIGSGPVNFEATRMDDGVTFTEYGGSNRTASVYILNAHDGTPAKKFDMDGHSFMADPIAVDFDLDANGTQWSGEAIYIASDGCGA